MPMIRYRIGDMGVLDSGPCPCGRSLPRLKSIAGRVTDFLVACDGRLVSGVYLATYVVAQRPSLGQVQIRQERAGQIRYLVKPGPGYSGNEDREFLSIATKEFLGHDTVVQVEIVQNLAAEPSGKYLFSISTAVSHLLQTAHTNLSHEHC
jgi:phenylacetate-CoA ligase